MKHLNVLALAALAGLATAAHAGVTISMVYGGGGNSGSIWQRDFVELHNNDAVNPVDISGWSVQYAGATAAFSAANSAVFPASTIIPPGGYFLVAFSQGTGGTTALPTPDFNGVATGTGAVLMSATSGKVALVNNATPIVTCTDASVVDIMGYGPTTNCSEGGPLAVLSNTSAAVRNTGGCTDTNSNTADFAIVTANAFSPRNSSTVFLCPGFPDCNNNGIPDATDISSNTSQDCNHDGTPDECQLAGNDCNGNGTLDSCELAGHDCNGNGIIDSCELATGFLTDVNVNGIPDVCEGAIVVSCTDNITANPAGIRPGGNGTAFVNVEGINNGSAGNPPPALASYGGARWDVGAVATALSAAYPSGYQIDTVHLALTQSNAAFTFDGPVDLYWTGNDTQDFTVPGGTTPNAATTFFNFPTDYPDQLLVQQYEFVRGSGPNGGNGTREAYKLFDLAGGNNAAQDAINADLGAGTGTLTLLLHPGTNANYPAPDGDPFVAATYAGRTNATFRGPTLVIFAHANSGPACDPDVNQDGNVDQDDVAYLINVVGGGDNPTGIDPDFNHDGNVDQDDIAALINVVAGGNCP